jgi:hypothetical protein
VRFLSTPGGPAPIGEGRLQRRWPIGRSFVSYLSARVLDRGVYEAGKALARRSGGPE